MTYNVYVDGSYKDSPRGGVYASAAVIYEEGCEGPVELTNAASNQEYASMRNVAGEILAVFIAMEYLMNQKHITQSDTVIVNHDYVGIANWCAKAGDKNYWRAKNVLTQSYRNYMVNAVKTRCKLIFNHTPGHTGIEGNEKADKLAKSALEQYILRNK